MKTMTNCRKSVLLLALTSILVAPPVSCSSSASSSVTVLIRVDQSGKGDFKTIQDAIDAVPLNNRQHVFISVKPGVYREKIVVPANKPLITLSGTSAGSTVITWAEGWDTLESPTVSVLASDFVARYLTIENTFGPSGPAVALRVVGDRAAFYSCRFLSYQDTLLDDSGRHYYSNCYIEGATDFICGDGNSLFEKCHIHSISKIGGAMTAQRRTSPLENTGYSFVACKITGEGTKTTLLGRPWGKYSRVVYAYTYMSDAVIPQGWDDWGHPSNQRTTFYGQYKCYGPGSNTSNRVSWSYNNLSDDEATKYMSKSVMNGKQWLRPLPTQFTKASDILSKAVNGKS